MSVTKLRAAIVDDHAIVRWAIRQLLSDTGTVEVVGEAGNGADAVALVQRTRPDILLLDLSMPEKDGFEVLKDIAALRIGTKVLILTMHVEEVYGARAIKAGAFGFIHKNAEPEALLAAVNKVAAGERVAPPAVLELLAKRDPAALLSQRELEVMEFLARGLSNREIAERLEISIKTVDTHRGHVLKKLKLRNNSDITRFAIQHGYVTPEQHLT